MLQDRWGAADEVRLYAGRDSRFEPSRRGPPEQRPAPASTQGASSATEGAWPQEGAKGSPPSQADLTALYNGMKAAAEKDGLAGLVKWWREHQKEIKALPEPGANQIAAWKEEFKSVLEIGGFETAAGQ